MLINNTNQPDQLVEALFALDKFIAAATGIDGETDYIVFDGAEHWRMRTIAAGDNTYINEAIVVVQVGEDPSQIQSWAPPP